MGLFKPTWMTDTKDFAKVKKIAESIYNTETDEKKLAEIAKNAPNDVIRQAAIEKISDLSILADLAQNDARTDTRLRAINMLGHRAKSAAESQSAFEHIVKNERDGKLREAALWKMENRIFLEEIAKNDGDYYFRSVAIKTLFGIKPVLALSTQERIEFYSVIKNISDRSILEDIKKNSDNKHERRESEVRLFILSDMNESCEKHNWVTLDYCLKKCTVCGALEYDHKYKCTNQYDTGLSTRATYRCEKCGINAEDYTCPNPDGDYNTMQTGLVKEIDKKNCKTGNHKWTHLTNCRKECDICGTVWYDHDLECTFSPIGDNGLPSEYRCRKCGYEGFQGGQGGAILESGIVY